MANRIIVVDDDQDYLEILGRKLGKLGYLEITLEDDSAAAAAAFENGAGYDLALIDMHMPGIDGLALLEIIKNTSPATECIMVTAVNEARTAVDCLKKGAYDYLVKPVPGQSLALSIQRAMEHKRLIDLIDLKKGRTAPSLDNPDAFASIVTRCRAMLHVLREAELHAASNVPILITGESGTGKELLARAIHRASPRADRPFTAVNMASVAGNLFEAEFFGHTRGAFTGADKRRAGLLANTDRGTLFLDEIGDLPPDLQGKLLRVLQDGEYTMVGSSRPRQVNLRIIAATNTDLEQMMIARKTFRKDLYYRIRGGWLHLPPLRQRRQDIPLLVSAFGSRYSGKTEFAITPRAMELLLAYDYPGNVRELKSIIQSSLNLSRGKPLAPAHLPPNIRRLPQKAKARARQTTSPVKPLAQAEKEHILSVYRVMGGNKSRTARALGIGINTLRRKLVRYGAE